MEQKPPGSQSSFKIDGDVKDATIVVGNNNVVTSIIRKYIFKDLRQLILVICSLLLVGGSIAGAYWYSKQPRKMTGNFNVAIAQFGQIQQDGSIAASAQAAKIANTLFNFLDSEYRASDIGLNVQVEHKNIPLITEDAQAQELAAKINASIVIYGDVYVNGDQAEFSPRFYVSERRDTAELTGQNELALPINFQVSQLNTQDKVNAELRTRTEVLFNFTKALIYFSDKNTNAALQADMAAIAAAQKAEAPFGGEEVLYLLASQIHASKKDFVAANAMLDQALVLNPQYSRAYLQRGNILYLLAQDAEFDPALLDGAQAAYMTAFQMPNQPDGAYIPIKAHDALGNILLVKAQVQGNSAELFAQAVQYYQFVVDEYQRTKDPFMEKYAAIAYFGIGAANEKQGKMAQALENYNKADSLTEELDFTNQIQQRIIAVQTASPQSIPPSSSMPPMLLATRVWWCVVPSVLGAVIVLVIVLAFMRQRRNKDRASDSD